MEKVKQFVEKHSLKNKGWGIVPCIANLMGISKGGLSRDRFLKLINQKLETINYRIIQVETPSGLPDMAEAWSNFPNEPQYRIEKINQ